MGVWLVGCRLCRGVGMCRCLFMGSGSGSGVRGVGWIGRWWWWSVWVRWVVWVGMLRLCRPPPLPLVVPLLLRLLPPTPLKLLPPLVVVLVVVCMCVWGRCWWGLVGM